MLRLIICFDVTDDKRRSRAVKVLETYGHRLQYSVFEVRVSEKSLVHLEAALDAELDYSEDRLMMIRLCSDCGRLLIMKGEPCSAFDDDLIV